MTRVLIALHLLLLACTAQAQRQAPAAIELRAAYCISVLSGRSEDAQIRAALPGPRASQEELRQIASAYDRDVRRLRGYLLPRMKFLDGEPLLAATDRGEADVKLFLEKEASCKGACEKEPAVERVRACTPVNWL